MQGLNRSECEVMKLQTVAILNSIRKNQLFLGNLKVHDVVCKFSC